MYSEKAIKQLNELKRLGREIRLAADGWNEDWKILIATLMSARTTDKITIPIAEKLFQKYNSVEKLAGASAEEIAEIIRGVNFYKGKSKRIKSLAEIIVRDYNSEVPIDFDKLVELPGVGRKTANVFLAEKGHGTIGIDTHVGWISKQLGWTKYEEQKKVEEDLKNLFPEKMWGEINWILVRFGQTFPSRKKKLQILEGIKNLGDR